MMLIADPTSHHGGVKIPDLQFAGTVINAADPDSLASFYESLLGWPRLMDEPDWIALRHLDGGTAIAFQRSDNVAVPTWPPEPGQQQMSLHLDFMTDDLNAAVEHALACGASASDAESPERERVLIDPAGNPFCLIRTAPTPPT